MRLTRELHEEVCGCLGCDVRAEEWGGRRARWTGADSGQIQWAAAASWSLSDWWERWRQRYILRLLFDVCVIGGGFSWGLAQSGRRRSARAWRRLRLGLLGVGARLLFHLKLSPREVLVAAHVQLQAEVTRWREGTQLTLECLTPVLVLVHLK